MQLIKRFFSVRFSQLHSCHILCIKRVLEWWLCWQLHTVLNIILLECFHCVSIIMFRQKINLNEHLLKNMCLLIRNFKIWNYMILSGDLFGPNCLLSSVFVSCSLKDSRHISRDVQFCQLNNIFEIACPEKGWNCTIRTFVFAIFSIK